MQWLMDSSLMAKRSLPLVIYSRCDKRYAYSTPSHTPPATIIITLNKVLLFIKLAFTVHRL